MVVKHRRPIIEPRVCHESLEPEEVEIEMVAELVTQRVEERAAERSDVLAYRCPHPQRMFMVPVVVAEQFGCPVLATASGLAASTGMLHGGTL